jgi:hypothetical protein
MQIISAIFPGSWIIVDPGKLERIMLRGISAKLAPQDDME